MSIWALLALALSYLVLILPDLTRDRVDGGQRAVVSCGARSAETIVDMVNNEFHTWLLALNRYLARREWDSHRSRIRILRDTGRRNPSH